MAEEESIIFKSEGGAFDRAGVNKDIASGNSASVTEESIDKMKGADKAIEAVRKFYNKTYEEAVKKLDPKYDPTEGEYYWSYSEQGSDLKFFRKVIDAGGSIDSVKDLIPRAKRTAESFINNVNQIKNGSVTKVISQIGIGDIKVMDDYDAVKQAFDKGVSNEEKSFDKLLSKFESILEYYDQPGLTAQSIKTLYTPDNNAIISALATIIKGEIKNESVDKASGGFEKNLEILSKSTTAGGEKAEEKAGEKTEEKKKEESIVKVEAQKLDAKKEESKKESPKVDVGKLESVAGEKKQEAKKEEAAPEAKSAPSAIAATTESKSPPSAEAKPIESNTTPSAEAKPAEAKSTAQESKTELASKEETKNSSETIGQGNQGAADFFSSIFGGGGGKKEESVESASSGKSPEAKTEVTKVASKTEVKAASMESAKGPVLSTSKTAIEKKSVASETNKASTSIKETSPQKLASASTITETQKPKTEEAPKNAETTKPEEGAAAGTENSEAVTGATEEKKEETSKDSTASAGGDDLSKKMDIVAGLLAQMNETLQGPLLVTGFSKKFE